MSSCSPEACIHRVMATFNSPIKAAEHVSFVKRYLNPHLFQVSLLLEAKTLTALSLGKRKVRREKKGEYIKKKMQPLSVFHLRLSRDRVSLLQDAGNRVVFGFWELFCFFFTLITPAQNCMSPHL